MYVVDGYATSVLECWIQGPQILYENQAALFDKGHIFVAYIFNSFEICGAGF